MEDHSRVSFSILLGLFDQLHQSYSQEARFGAEDDVMLFNFPVQIDVQNLGPGVLSSRTLDEMKSRLPVMKFGDYVDRLGVCNEETCAVCLSSVETSHEMRELSNCCHVFHKECLDSWVDQSQVTCPTCRSNLFSFLQGDQSVLEKLNPLSN